MSEPIAAPTTLADDDLAGIAGGKVTFTDYIVSSFSEDGAKGAGTGGGPHVRVIDGATS